ncbi:hypothetical protein [Thioalkalivibrio sp. HK1]|uniref:hypothetical protein n=1 Tax=Thioalkalivibrio sp. HK1 TaxID=1469245 RepID=UPI0004706669|nr:hypothetical protein [Thioalkalivibrio sp. HK1]
MKALRALSISALIALWLTACTSAEDIVSSATGERIVNMKAHGPGARSGFDGTVDSKADLERLVVAAWGDGRLGLHRGHADIQNVLEAYLGITHREMHVLMEDEGMNLAAICEKFGFDPVDLIDTLTASFAPFVEEGVDNGVISAKEADIWIERIGAEFRNRVHWEG